MPAPAELLDLYLHLARASEEQRKPLQRDKFLVLAGGAALEAGYPRVAEECRQRLLADNPNHILRNFGSMRDAFSSEDIRHYTNQLLRTYPFEKAEYLLEKYRAGGYSSGHGYGPFPSKSDSGIDDVGGSRRSLSQSTVPAKSRRLPPPINDLPEFDIPEISSFDDFDFAEFERAHMAAATERQMVPLRAVYVWIMAATLAGISIGVAATVAVQQAGR